MDSLYMIFAVVIVVIFPSVRCIIFNLHYIGVYTVKDIYAYFKYKKWKDFNFYGITMFVGMFGHGKTLSMVHKAQAIYAKFGNDVRFISNIDLLDIPYEPLINFEQVCSIGEVEDGRVGTVVLIDEVSSVLSHRNYANFPIEMLNVLTQQRKKKVYIMCTAQRFFMVDKLFRSITTWVVDCNKFWRLQSNRFYDAWEVENATSTNILKWKGNRWWFVKNHDYACYDTFQMISKNSSKEFISNDETIRRKGLESSVVFNQAGVTRGNRKFKKMTKSDK